MSYDPVRGERGQVSYERKARLYPALLLFIPVAVVVGCGLGTSVSRVEADCVLIVSCGGLFIACSTRP